MILRPTPRWHGRLDLENLAQRDLHPALAEEEALGHELVVESTTQLREELDSVLAAGNVVATPDDGSPVAQLRLTDVSELPGNVRRETGIQRSPDPKVQGLGGSALDDEDHLSLLKGLVARINVVTKAAESVFENVDLTVHDAALQKVLLIRDNVGLHGRRESVYALHHVGSHPGISHLDIGSSCIGTHFQFLK